MKAANIPVYGSISLSVETYTIH